MTRRRRGYALIEMLLVISSLVVVLGVSVALIHSLMRLDRKARDHLADSSSRDRLGRQFRADVRAASQSSLADGAAADAERLELKGPGTRIVDYVPGEDRVIRNERDGDRVIRREEYRTPSQAPPRFRSRQDDGGVFVILSFRRKADSAPASPLRLSEYEALLDRDSRLAKPRGGGS